MTIAAGAEPLAATSLAGDHPPPAGRIAERSPVLELPQTTTASPASSIATDGEPAETPASASSPITGPQTGPIEVRASTFVAPGMPSIHANTASPDASTATSGRMSASPTLRAIGIGASHAPPALDRASQTRSNGKSRCCHTVMTSPDSLTATRTLLAFATASAPTEIVVAAAQSPPAARLDARITPSSPSQAATAAPAEFAASTASDPPSASVTGAVHDPPARCVDVKIVRS